MSGGSTAWASSVVNALSTRVDIEVRAPPQGFHWTQTYIDQHPTAPLEAGQPMTEGESTRYVCDFLGRPEDFRDHHLRLRDAAFPLPADGAS